MNSYTYIDSPIGRLLLGTDGEALIRIDMDVPDRPPRDLENWTWIDAALPSGASVAVQVSAHGEPQQASVTDRGVALHSPARRVAPGQLVALYCGDAVAGSAIAC